MVNYYLCSAIAFVALIIFLCSLLIDGIFEPIHVSYSRAFSLPILGLAIMILIPLTPPSATSSELLVNPTITRVAYRVTHIETDLDTGQRTYVLISKDGDKETLSSYDANHLKKGDKLVKEQYRASKAQFLFVYRIGNYKVNKWILRQ